VQLQLQPGWHQQRKKLQSLHPQIETAADLQEKHASESQGWVLERLLAAQQPCHQSLRPNATRDQGSELACHAHK
jgi:IS30 family transposase